MTGKIARTSPSGARSRGAATDLPGRRGAGWIGVTWLGLMIVTQLASTAITRSQDTPAAPPLPDRESFLAETRQNLERSRRDSLWAYTERRTELHMNPFGRVGSGDAGETTAYQVTPSPDGASV